MNYRFAIGLAVVVFVAGCAPTSQTKIGESTAPSTISSPHRLLMSGDHRITVFSNEIGSTDPQALEDAAYDRAEEKCEKFDVYQSYFVTRANERGLTLEIRCLEITRGKIKSSGRGIVTRMAEPLADSSAFDIHAETFEKPINTVFDAIVRILESQGDSIYEADRKKHTIITGRKRHGVLGFPRYEQYVVVLEEETDTQTSVSFMLLIHHPVFGRDLNQTLQNKVPMQIAPRKFVYERAAVFVDKLKNQLK
jgi:hypothetical protein